ncbi:MAG TPA: carboxypeptidase regulatory-like domain-containing protein [Gemmatimonadaceae bacterium]|nr:carboxypeptidase regulatory-like domain-containing protein [Gemmatimonadaceae bacterium]
MLRRFVDAAGLIALAAASAGAQRLAGTIVEADGKTPASFVALLILNAGGNTIARAQSSASGSFSLAVPSAGTYAVRALRVGFKPTLSDPVTIAAGDAARIRMQLTNERIVLAPVQVRERATCGTFAARSALIETWDQARAALLGVARTEGVTNVRFETLTWTIERDVWPDTGTRMTAESSGRSEGAAYRSPPARELLRSGFVRTLGDSVEFHAPDAFVLLDPEFAESYCFLLEPAPAGHPEWIGLGVTPSQLRAGNVAIDGVLWLTRDGALQRFDYSYLGMDRLLEAAQPGGRVDFLRLPTGEWIVSRWSIRMPQAVTDRQPQGLSARENAVVRLGRIVERGAVVTRVQMSDGQYLTPGQQPLSLTIKARDGSAQSLLGTTVSLPTEGLSWISGSSTVIDMGPMGPGRHRFMVQTPLMRDVGLAPEVVDMTLLPDSTALQLALYVPSVSDVRRRLCPESPNEPVAIGTLPATGVAALGKVYVTRAGENAALRRSDVVVDSSGRWHACGLLRGTSLVLLRDRGGVTETLARFRIPRAVDVAFVGSFNAQPSSLAASLPTASPAAATARLTIRALVARDSSLLRDAEAIVDDSLLVRPNARRELRVSELAEGKHVVTVRSLGFTPVTDTIAISGSDARAHTVWLERLPPLLAEVKVRGRMVRVPLKFAEVLQRASSGWGTLFTREDIKAAAEVNSLLATLPGTIAEDHTVAFQSCAVSIDPSAPRKVQVYVDGVRVTMVPQYSGSGKGIGGDDEITLILKTVNMADIEFIEVYRGPAQIPAVFVNDACAVIAIWTKAY